jgi:aconitate hydratase
MYLGVKAVIAKSIERIHLANLINFGIVPFVFDNPADYERIAAGDRFEIASLRAVIAGDGKAVIRTAKGVEIRVTVTLTERQKKLLLAGGLLPAVARGEA